MIRLGLAGFPLGHSLSPRIHAAALRACELRGIYDLHPVPPDDPAALHHLLGRVRAGEIHGLNVTIPHKQAVIPYLDALTPAAQAIGAVNVIYCRDGKLTGDNTDAPGFLADVKKFLAPVDNPNFEQRHALILGAGGSARSVVYALVCDGWQVTLVARRAGQASALLALHASALTCRAFSDLASLDLSSVSLLVNTTPLGMTPNPQHSPWPGGLPFPRGAVVYDLIYNPRETLLVREARAAGLRAATGLGMLVEQAALAFEIWTGQRPPRDVLFAAVEDS